MIVTNIYSAVTVGLLSMTGSADVSYVCSAVLLLDQCVIPHCYQI